MNLKERFERTPLPFERMAAIGKVLIFLALVLAEIILSVDCRDARVEGIPVLLVILPVSAALAAENAVKLFALRSFKRRIVCYVIDILLLLVLTYFSGGRLISTLFVIILSEFYLSQEKLAGNIAMGVCSAVLYLAMLAVSQILRDEAVALDMLISNAFEDLIIFVLHFLIMNFLLLIYRKNEEIAKRVKELDESNQKLEESNQKLAEAMEKLKEVTALEERQRIAKDIHDTAGHSITTVIMQTEAAKLALERDPTGAKRSIVAANLQAKHALEELRESVHLLSGSRTQMTLKDMLLDIIHESTDGTGIAVRCDIDDVALCDAKCRFLCNTLKEGISNGLRHGGATAFYFELKKGEKDVSFLLSDNGSGLELSSLKEGFGLKGMHSRAASLGGSVWFETEQDEGFEIHLRLPLDGGR